jgi:uncharacterized protein (TIGR00290 family)
MKVARTLLSWSSGKDSAFALAELRKQTSIEVVGLLTTVNAAAARVAMHAVRRELLEIQAKAVGLPLWTVEIPSPCPNDVYEAAMASAIRRALRDGITHMAFGDLFLADIRAYREAQLLGTGMTPLFPLWARDTRLLAEEMIASGTRAVLTCVDPRQLEATYAGRSFDKRLLADLPAECDPCGERGEFHTFAWDGPAFRHPVPIRVGETVERDGFVFTDLLPAEDFRSVG